MNRRVVGFALIAVLAACCAFAADAPKGIAWLPDFEKALKASATSGKPILANFVSQYCEFCRDMDREVLSTAQVAGLLRKFDCVRIDVDKRDDLVMKYKTFRVPAYVFLDSKGEVFYQFSGYYPADVFCVKVRDALHLWQARPELQKLQALYDAGKATPTQLARLGYLLRLSDRPALAREVLQAALEALPETDEARANVELDLGILAASDGSATGLGQLEAWVFAHPTNERVWEARYQLGIAQANRNAIAQAVGTFNSVVAGAADTDWGVLSKYYVALLGPEVDQPKTGG